MEIRSWREERLRAGARPREGSRLPAKRARGTQAPARAHPHFDTMPSPGPWPSQSITGQNPCSPGQPECRHCLQCLHCQRTPAQKVEVRAHPITQRWEEVGHVASWHSVNTCRKNDLLCYCSYWSCDQCPRDGISKSERTIRCPSKQIWRGLVRCRWPAQ